MNTDQQTDPEVNPTTFPVMRHDPAAGLRKQLHETQSQVEELEQELARCMEESSARSATWQERYDEAQERHKAELATLQKNYEIERNCGGERMTQILNLQREVEKALGLHATAPADPHAHLKTAWAAGKRIRCVAADGGWQPWQSINTGSNFVWTLSPDCYEIELDATPADPWAAERDEARYALTCEQENAKNLRYWQEKAVLRIKELEVELARHQWRPVSVKPTAGDTDAEGYVCVCSADGRIRGVHRIEWPFGTGVTHWRPFCTPPSPTAEEVERERFEIWAVTSSFGHDLTRTPCGKYYTSLFTYEAWCVWQAARAAKGGEA